MLEHLSVPCIVRLLDYVVTQVAIRATVPRTKAHDTIAGQLGLYASQTAKQNDSSAVLAGLYICIYGCHTSDHASHKCWVPSYQHGLGLVESMFMPYSLLNNLLATYPVHVPGIYLSIKQVPCVFSSSV